MRKLSKENIYKSYKKKSIYGHNDFRMCEATVMDDWKRLNRNGNVWKDTYLSIRMDVLSL